ATASAASSVVSTVISRQLLMEYRLSQDKFLAHEGFFHPLKKTLVLHLEIGLPEGLAEFPQELLLFLIQIGGYHHLHGDNLIAPAGTVQPGNAFSSQGKSGPVLGPFRNANLVLAVQGVYFHLAPQSRLDDGNGDLHVDIVVFTPEN